MGKSDFRAASEEQGYGNLMLTPGQQAEFGGSCQRSSFPLRVDGDGNDSYSATEGALGAALHTAWTLRLERNARSRATTRGSTRHNVAHRN
jgi:hypothetical protein